MRRRERIAVAIAALMAAAAVGGVVSAAFIKSPAQVAADTAPPKRNVLTATVADQQIRDTLVVRGTFATQDVVKFTPTSAVAPNGEGADSTSLVVTGLPAAPGQTVEDGEVIAQVSGRPVIALEGAFPAFRNMVEGDSGPDIAELQEALEQLGFPVGSDVAGTFGPGTADAVRAFYAAIGYSVPLIPGEGASGPTGPKASNTGTSGTGTGTGTGSQATRSPPATVEVPMSEVMFVPSLPAPLTEAPVEVGQAVSAPLLGIAVGGLSLTAQFNASQRNLLHTGLSVRVLSSITGATATGSVSSIGATTADTTNASAYVPVDISTAHGPWAPSWNGQNVQVTAVVPLTPTAVLTVPESAIRTTANGTEVIVRTKSGSEHPVAVTTGISAGGNVEVTNKANSLRAGDRVVVG